MGIWEVQTYTLVRGKEEEHEAVIKKVGEHLDKMGKKYLCFDKMFGPMFSKVLILVHESLQDMEGFEDEWWKDEDRTIIGNTWVSCVDYNSYKQIFWQENTI